MSELLWVVTPSFRPHLLEQIHHNFSRQTYDNKRLCIVKNGPAWQERGGYVTADLLVDSPQDVGAARNAGKEAVFKAGGQWLVYFDDDDYFGPHYLEEVAEQLGKAQVLGKNMHFVEIDGHMYARQWGLAHKTVSRVYGSGMVVNARNALKFGGGPGEDVSFCFQIRASGGQVLNLSIFHMLVRRYGPGHNHTWKVRRSTLGPLEDLGPVNLEIINEQADFTLGRTGSGPRRFLSRQASKGD